MYLIAAQLHDFYTHSAPQLGQAVLSCWTPWRQRCRNKILTLRQTPEDAEAQDFRACVEHFTRCGWSEEDFAASAAGADAHMAALLERVARAAGIAAHKDDAAKCAAAFALARMQSTQR